MRQRRWKYIHESTSWITLPPTKKGGLQTIKQRCKVGIPNIRSTGFEVGRVVGHNDPRESHPHHQFLATLTLKSSMERDETVEIGTVKTSSQDLHSVKTHKTHHLPTYQVSAILQRMISAAEPAKFSVPHREKAGWQEHFSSAWRAMKRKNRSKRVRSDATLRQHNSLTIQPSAECLSTSHQKISSRCQDLWWMCHCIQEVEGVGYEIWHKCCVPHPHWDSHRCLPCSCLQKRTRLRSCETALCVSRIRLVSASDCLVHAKCRKCSDPSGHCSDNHHSHDCPERPTIRHQQDRNPARSVKKVKMYQCIKLKNVSILTTNSEQPTFAASLKHHCYCVKNLTFQGFQSHQSNLHLCLLQYMAW